MVLPSEVAIVLLVSSRFLYLVLFKWLSNFAYKIEIEWWVFVGSGLVVVVIAIMITGFHALKAAAANPVDSLKTE